MDETPLQTLERLRPTYGTPMTLEENGALLNEVAWVHRAAGWGVYVKDSGNHCVMPNGTKIARDILLNRFTKEAVDCLYASEDVGTPQWMPGVPFIEWARYVPPIDPGVIVEPPVPPVDVPPPQVIYVPLPPITTYESWVSGADFQILNAAFIAKHGVEPHAEYWRHLSVRRLVERWTIADMVKDI